MIGHDYNWPEVKAAVDTFRDRTDIKTVDYNKNFWVIERNVS